MMQSNYLLEELTLSILLRVDQGGRNWKDRSRTSEYKTSVMVQVRDGDGSQQNGRNGGGEKWADCGYI